VSLRFTPNKGLIVCPTRIWGPSGDVGARLALDTGATGSSIDAELLKLIGYDPASSPNLIQLTTGSRVELTPVISAKHIEALGMVRSHFEFVSHTFPKSSSVAGVLGLDFFTDQQLLIDFRHGLVTLN